MKLLHEVLLTMLMKQQTVTNPAVIRDLCAMTNITSAIHARSGSPPMINHLTSIKLYPSLGCRLAHWCQAMCKMTQEGYNYYLAEYHTQNSVLSGMHLTKVNIDYGKSA